MTDQKGQSLPVLKDGRAVPHPELDDGAWVTFDFVPGTATTGARASQVLPLTDETDIAALEYCFSDLDPSVWRAVTALYFGKLLPEEVVAAARQKRKTMSDPLDWEFLLRQVPVEVHVHQAGRMLHKGMSDKEILRLYLELRKGLDRPVPLSFEQEIVRLTNASPPTKPKRKPTSTPSRAEIPTTEPGISVIVNDQQEDLAQQRKWLRAIAGYVLVCGDRVKFPSADIYGGLTAADRSLAEMWCGNMADKEYVMAKMLSARAAEHVALRVYRSLGYKVQDVALSQLDGSSKDWVTHDLLLDGTLPVDVKNARSPVHRKIRYVEHCVPQFKEARDRSTPVTIAGVFSPYLKLEYIDDVRSASFNVPPVIFLGETTNADIDALKHCYESEYLDIVPQSKSSGRKGSVIPPWVFDYPDRLYHRVTDAWGTLRKLFQEEQPSYELIKRYYGRPLPSLLAANIAIPESWRAQIPFVYADLYHQLMSISRKNGRVTLPNLYLTILTHFVETIQGSIPNGYTPGLYAELIFPGRQRGQHERPLGLYDPLKVCWTLCDALKTLWDGGRASDLLEFRRFRFQGLGLLRGTRRNDGREVTLLAYCGGKVDGKGLCGESPLIWGREKTCTACGKLICPKCHYCSEDCPQ